jgi:hypothetical protein
VPLPIDNNFSGSRPHQIMLTEQINPRLVQGDNVVPLARALPSGPESASVPPSKGWGPIEDVAP